MNISNRALWLKLLDPKPPVRVSIDGIFALTVQVVTTLVSECEMRLMFDSAFLKEISGHPDHEQLHGKGRIAQEVSWCFQAKKATPRTYITVEGQGEGLFQKVEFPVEVMQ